MTDQIDPELARLVAAHPSIFRGRPPAFASNLSEGWYALVDKLCFDIEGVLGAGGLKRFEVWQIKQKFGTLRFYWHYRSANLRRVGTLPAEDFASFGASQPKSDRRRDILDGLVDAACSASATICETCGRSGRLVEQNGWRMTRCTEHTLCSEDADEY